MSVWRCEAPETPFHADGPDRSYISIIKDVTLLRELYVLYTECGLDCHKKCEKFIPNLCGVNQKILAEMLDDLKLSNKVGQR